MLKIAHLTSVHPRFDTRIFYKQCMSLSGRGYSVSLVVADGLGDAMVDSISIYDVGKAKGRLARMFQKSKDVYQKAMQLSADVYHLHDPELIPIGLKLRRSGKVVIFDAHEDVPLQILSKSYLARPLRVALSWFFSRYEKFALKKYSAVIAATPFIRDKFLRVNKVTVDINNYPKLGELETPNSWQRKLTQVCYVGGISTVRGIRELVSSMGYVTSGARLALAGNFSDTRLRDELLEYDGWTRVDERGYLNRSGVCELLGESLAGVVTLHPIANYLDSLPVKMFEYMSAGLPVIASDFPLWREIIYSSGCGMCVDPLEPKFIAQAIDYLVNHPAEAEAMGRNGRDAVLTKYNWSIEEEKLFELYERLH